jgi:hypothetical protein
MNLSEVCEVMTGLNFNDMTEANPFDRIDTIADAAAPILVSDRYDLLDNGDDKNSFLRMLIEHYWEYEVCALTPSDFILRLNRKLNEIAPLFNQRYESMKMEFPVFQDVNTWTDGQVDRTAHKTDVLDGEVRNSGTDTTGYGKKESGSADTMSGNGQRIPKDTRWDYNNDTPQNSISGITENDYLTNYSKHTDEVDNKDVVVEGYGGQTIAGDGYSMGEGAEGNFVKYKQTDGGSFGRTQSYTGSKQSGEDTFTHGHKAETDNTFNSDATSQDVSGSHTYGKNNSGKTYAQMMEEYRHAMINVFKEMIDELHELFFIIY